LLSITYLSAWGKTDSSRIAYATSTGVGRKADCSRIAYTVATGVGGKADNSRIAYTITGVGGKADNAGSWWANGCKANHVAGRECQLIAVLVIGKAVGKAKRHVAAVVAVGGNGVANEAVAGSSNSL